MNEKPGVPRWLATVAYIATGAILIIALVVIL